jgi:uncharacterized protein YeeX (DUF496 family)
MTSTYTKTEIDQMIQEMKDDLERKIDNVIILSDESNEPDPEETSLWMKIRNS